MSKNMKAEIPLQTPQLDFVLTSADMIILCQLFVVKTYLFFVLWLKL